MVGAVAEVVEPAVGVGGKTAGGSAHAVAIGAFDDVGCGRESSSADGVILGTGPESEDNEIGLLGLPPAGVADVGGRRPEDGRGGRFRISNFGMWPCYAPHLRDYAGLLPRVIKFVRSSKGGAKLGR